MVALRRQGLADSQALTGALPVGGVDRQNLFSTGSDVELKAAVAKLAAAYNASLGAALATADTAGIGAEAHVALTGGMDLRRAIWSWFNRMSHVACRMSHVACRQVSGVLLKAAVS